MPDRDFEQQVRDGLQEWRIDPSDRVWIAISGQIRKRRRRWALFWLPLAVGLLCAGGWFWFNSGTAPSGKVAVTRSPAAVGQTQAGQESTGQMPSAEPRAKSAQPSTGHSSGVSGRATGVSVRASGVSAAGAEGLTAASGTATAVSAPAPTASVPATAAREQGRIIAVAPAEPEAGAGTSAQALSLRYTPGLAGISPCTPCYPDPKLAFQPLTSGAMKNTSMNPPLKKTNPPLKKWQARFYAGAGVSGQGQAFHFNTPAENAVYDNFTTSNPSNLPGSAATKDTLAARKSGAGVQIGVGWSRRLSRHWKVGTGLEYDFWQTAFDPIYPATAAANPSFFSTATSNYSTGYGERYVNGYQLLQVPLVITWQMSPGRRWNPSLYSGLSIAYLFSGEALMYAPDESGYVKNSSLLRHWSGYWETGLKFDVWHIGKHALDAGPVFQYGLSGLQKGAPVSDHLNYIGIQLGFTLPGK